MVTDDPVRRPWRPVHSVYLASPLGFCPAGRLFMPRVVTALEQAGLTVLNPWDLPGDQIRTWQQRGLSHANRLIGAHNERLLSRADAVFAILDGADVDSGTASEIGYAYAHGKLVVGYRGDFRLTGENVAAGVNIQVAHFIWASGGRVFMAAEYGECEDPAGKALEEAIRYLREGEGGEAE